MRVFEIRHFECGDVGWTKWIVAVVSVRNQLPVEMGDVGQAEWPRELLVNLNITADNLAALCKIVNV
jgi:hypothetical protein